MKLQSFAENHWFESESDGVQLKNAIDGQPVAFASSEGLDYSAMLDYARRVGGPNLRRHTFHQRANMLKALAKMLLENKKELYALSTQTGATRSDTWIDVDGGISTLFVYSGKGRREMPNSCIFPDGPTEPLSKNGTFVGQHVFLPLEGAAVHINAFNFPCWGMLEKLAPCLLAGVPAIVKPATSTSYLTELMFRRMIESEILPEGSIQLICGGVGDLLDHLNCQDVVAFTGSKNTAEMLQQNANVIDQSVRFTAETDSLNASVLGPDAGPGTPEFDLYIKEIVREMTVKAGQKCTAIRRIIAPSQYTAELVTVLGQALAEIRIGNPANKEVQMGALASFGQRDEVRERVGDLSREADIVCGNMDHFEVIDADARKGSFFAPVVLQCQDPLANGSVHHIEAFGPVSTVLPYDSLDDAITLARMGGGSLVGSVFTNDDEVAETLALGMAPFHGRLLITNRDSAGESTGHGSPMPHLIHGGPGRAGGGEEMGGIRGVLHYMQRTALQGSPTTLGKISKRWIRGGAENTDGPHPFTRTFEDLTIGDTLHTDSRTITVEDIENFAELSGDKFYAHMDEELAAKNPFFEGRVAHGYFIVSMAAGLFVEPNYGPVLANYGLDDLRFNTPVSIGDTLKVRLTCKQKSRREDEEYGEVRWDTEVTNQDGEVVAGYDVLTMVATKAGMAAAE
jgi:oxepin-CoA hydrolase/3-oxo-5,6-dehydrosuberyl-CoA semialdehyde dehydrogenase